MSRRKKSLAFGLVLVLLFGTFSNIKPLRFEPGWNGTEPMTLETEKNYNE